MSNSDCVYGCDGAGIMPEPDRRACRCMALAFAHIPRALHGKTFANFDASRAPVQFQAVSRWTEAWAPGAHSLMLIGAGKGTGKTHLMAAAANQLVLSGKVRPAIDGQVAFALAPDLMAKITGDAFNDRWLELSRHVLLFLDDVGQADEGDPAWLRAKKRDAWFRLINYRDMNGLTTVCTSNLDSVAKIADVLGEAAADRLLGMCTADGAEGLVKFTGITSYRLRALLGGGA